MVSMKQWRYFAAVMLCLIATLMMARKSQMVTYGKARGTWELEWVYLYVKLGLALTLIPHRCMRTFTRSEYRRRIDTDRFRAHIVGLLLYRRRHNAYTTVMNVPMPPRRSISLTNGAPLVGPRLVHSQPADPEHAIQCMTKEACIVLSQCLMQQYQVWIEVIIKSDPRYLRQC